MNMTVERRIYLRKLVDEYFQFVLLECETEQEQQHVKALFFDLVKPEKQETEDDEMNDEQAKKFGEQRMPYGAHCGWQIQDLPNSYLYSITDPNDFTKKLRQYVKWRSKHDHD